MRQRDLSTVLLKVLGVACIIKAVEFAGGMLVMILSMALGPHFSLELVDDFLHAVLPLLANLVFLLLPAFVLLRYADVIAERMFPTDASVIPCGARPTNEWYVFALSVIGAILLVWYVPGSIVMCVSNFLHAESEMGGQWTYSARRYAWQALARGVIQFSLGLYLVLGSRGIVACVRKLRRE